MEHLAASVYGTILSLNPVVTRVKSSERWGREIRSHVDMFVRVLLTATFKVLLGVNLLDQSPFSQKR